MKNKRNNEEFIIDYYGVKCHYKLLNDIDKERVSKFNNILKTKRNYKKEDISICEVLDAVYYSGLGKQIANEFGKQLDKKRVKSIVGMCVGIGAMTFLSELNIPPLNEKLLYCSSMLTAVVCTIEYLTTYLDEGHINQHLKGQQ